MLSRIKGIKGLGLVFCDFTWDANVTPFRQINLIYGWNGCGKTTLTRLFDDLATKSRPTLEYELENSDGATFTQEGEYPLPVRVFNQDYIQKNVRVLDYSASTISILLGEENKELVAQIEADERELNGDPADPEKIGKVRELYGSTQKKIRKETGNEKAFSDIARTVGAAIAGSGMASRNYRSPDAKRDYRNLKGPASQSEADLERDIQALRQEQLELLNPLELAAFDCPPGVGSPLLDYLAGAQSLAGELCSETAQTETIERLKDAPDIAHWVEEGS